MNIGVVGANGFVGKALCLKFIQTNNTVYAFYHQSDKNIPHGCKKIALQDKFDLGLDCLLIAIGNHSSNNQQYVQQLLTVHEIIHKIKFKKVVFVSSVEVYGESQHPIKENSCYNNPGNYGLSKIAQEFLIKSLENYVIIRPTYLYGNEMNSNSLLPMWLDKAKQKKVITVYGDGTRRQDYLHIDDFVELCWQIAQNSKTKDIVIAASGQSISNLELAQLICQHATGTKIEFVGSDFKYSSFYDVTHSKENYFWRSQRSIEQWIKSSIQDENFNL